MKRRLVLDTNIRISSLLTPSGVCARLIAALQRESHIQIISPEMLDELGNTLAVKFRWPAEQIALALRITSSQTERVQPGVTISVCRDPDDNRVLECALTGAAHWVITGDADLLTLNPWHDVQIVHRPPVPYDTPSARLQPLTIGTDDQAFRLHPQVRRRSRHHRLFSRHRRRRHAPQPVARLRNAHHPDLQLA